MKGCDDPCSSGLLDILSNPQGIYWGYIGIMENKMETTIIYRVYIGVILG